MSFRQRFRVFHRNRHPDPQAFQSIARTRQVVLILDTDNRISRYLRANLEAQGFRAVSTASLTDSLRIIELEEPDAVIMSNYLPEATRRIACCRSAHRRADQ